jgi:hypothetical protein
MSLPSSSPSPFNYILSFLIVGLCWGFTTPFIRKAAITYQVPSNPSITNPNRPWLLRQIALIFFSIIGLLQSPRYAVPLVLNLTGSIWFFLLVGQAGKLFKLTILLHLFRSFNLWPRTLSDCPHHKLTRLPLHCSRRMVCRWEAHHAGHLAGHGPRLRGYCNVCGV